MKHQAALTWAAIVLLAGISAGLGWWLGHRVLIPAEKAPPPGLVVVGEGDLLPSLVLPELESGQPFTVSGPGRPRLINYWASWCGPCREEMPALDAFAAQQGGNGVQVIGIALDTREDALAFQRQVPVAFTLLLESAGPSDSSVRLGNARGILPYTVLLDAQGRRVKTHYGAFPNAESVRRWAAD
ncbi:MAG: TlpA family protein disulfide reductase [Arenimonas sp.]|uniref:TlpA family protein disulfide reductase n=1 Tax=Arenimonas sp. TaxID=1872635 RepID=UPI0025BFE471|nr:TlpA disulfide reductase family protein [Arenimonas sp.]MBW8367393.1 TlpA family protein disulfide reductase [Arenimonas sp.]